MASRRDGPLVVQSDRTVLLDTHHDRAAEAREVLGQFAELLKSPDHLHTYRISPLSLWNAAAAGHAPEDVVAFLMEFSKFRVPKALRAEIVELMARFGRLLLRRRDGELVLTVSSDLWEAVAELPTIEDLIARHDAEACELIVKPEGRGELKRLLTRAGYPVEDLAGYHEGDALAFECREELDDGRAFGLRPYQLAAAQAFYQDGAERGGNGVVVLPCGAGKTIVGIGVLEMYQTQALILTNNLTSVRQWVREILGKTNLEPDQVAEYTSQNKNLAPITVSTYQMLTYRSSKTDGYPHFEVFLKSNWGLVIYDEVHLLPAPVFRLTAELQARRRLGLTATLIREDGREDEVFSLIGPKRYDTPWRRLERGGYIATARCVEMRVPLSRDDKAAYELAHRRGQYRLAAENVLKLRALEALLARHTDDRVLIIGMYLRQLAQIRALIGAEIITSKTSQEDRDRLYAEFREGTITRLIVSKVANFAVDLPDANVAIQVSGTFGSRQEEAQRLGRILRPKSDDRETVFYTLVTDDSREATFAANRKLFLTEQGYNYEITDVREEFSGLGWDRSVATRKKMVGS